MTNAVDMSEDQPYSPPPDEFNLLVTLLNQGDYNKGELLARELIKRFPLHGLSWYALASALKLQGRSAEGIPPMLEAATLEPHNEQLRCDLGVLYRDIHALTEAESCYRQALKINPDSFVANYNLGNTLHEQGRSCEAEAAYRQVVKQKPDYAVAYAGLGAALHDQGRLAEAEASYRQALRTNPGEAATHNNLGVLCKEQNRYIEAEEQFRLALCSNSGHLDAHNNLGNVLRDQGRIDEAETCYWQALRLKPDQLEVFSNLLLASNYANRPSLELARQYGSIVTRKAGGRYTAWQCEKTPGRLKVGLVSGDMRNHPVGFFLEGLLAEIDQNQFELVAYPTNTRQDPLTERIKPFFAAWRPLTGLDDQTAARLIHADALHVLIDLAGHTASNRLPLFALKPAPVQATWLGYLATTGVAEIDYLLGDPQATPPEHDDQYAETVWRLPEIWGCFTTPADAPAVNPLPAAANGYITFGCFNNLSKMREDVVKLWARILTTIPKSRLFLKTRQLSDPVLCEITRQRFAAQGIAAERLILEGPSPRAELLAAYHRIDIALDPFPYTGGTTSFEILWMGVPVITLQGDSFLSRGGLSIAQNAGLSDWIAESADDYLAKAKAHTSDIQQLADLRIRLRQQVRRSPLFDTVRFARQFEAALREMWRLRGTGV